MDIDSVDLAEIRKPSRELPKSAPYLGLTKTRKPLFPNWRQQKLSKTKIFRRKFSRPFFSKFVLKSSVSRIVPKNVKGGTLWDFYFLNIHYVAKCQKIGGAPFGNIKKFAKNVPQSRNNMHKKNWSRTRLEPTSFCFPDLKKS